MAEAGQATKPVQVRSGGLADTIEERRSQELVFALVGPIASGVSTAALYLQEILSQRFGYNLCPTIKLSEFIRAEAYRVKHTPSKNDPLDKYILDMQSAGNALREQFGGDYLAQKAVEQIVKFKRANGGFSPEGIPLPGRRAYVIDSLKNLEELSLLKSIYGDTLCLIGVFAPDALRMQRLVDSRIPKKSAETIVDRDAGELATFGQKTRKIFVEADLFLCNDVKTSDLRNRIDRYLDIIFDTGIHTPTGAEAAMYEAGAAAANSACMSRQVGAAIVSEKGELLSIGWNDVPRFGGGLYREDDQGIWDEDSKQVKDRDNRCFKWGGSICHNDFRRAAIVEDVVRRITQSGLLQKGATAAQVREALDGSPVYSLIEFSRSIHAEMEAVLGVAREGRHSLVGSTLYATTYPCHNCARHIVATGIKEVVYIEPYAKSLATELHWDAVSEVRCNDHVVFRQFDGVAPRNFLRFFRPTSERKMDGRLHRRTPLQAEPVLRIALDAPTDYEAKVIADLSIKEQTSLPTGDRGSNAPPTGQ
jgi:deoxycytidylate deaminase